MTPKNILSGFRVTGIYPFNQERVKAEVPQTKPTLAERTGLAYIPLYSPVRKKVCSKYDATTRPTTPESSDESSYLLERSFSESDLAGLRTKRATSITKFLNTPKHPSKLPSKNQKSAGKVLTSLEIIQAMEEKQMKKEEELRRKEERKRLREARAKEKQKKKGTKKKLVHSTHCIFAEAKNSLKITTNKQTNHNYMYDFIKIYFVFCVHYPAVHAGCISCM